ncbi:MAG: hypothetical protein VX464_15475 [Pseudomonadota bacterium]|nr:hypothetical protein [Pseudomonadota bacterium]
MPRNAEDDVEQLVETIREHCPNIVRSDTDGSRVRWFAEAIVFDLTHAVRAHQFDQNEGKLHKVYEALLKAGSLIDDLPDEAIETLRTCMPKRTLPKHQDVRIAAIEEAIVPNRFKQMDLGEFSSNLDAAAQALQRVLHDNSRKKRRRTTFDYDAVVVYRMCMKIWGEELALADSPPAPLQNSPQRARPRKFADDHEDDPQGQFTGEVFSTLGITTKVSSAAKRLSEEGGAEAWTYTYVAGAKD